MLYVNDPKEPYKTYQQAVDIAVENGVDLKRVYLYLMTLGVKGVKGRVMSEDFTDYEPVTKLAIKNGKLVTDIRKCQHCGNLEIMT